MYIIYIYIYIYIIFRNNLFLVRKKKTVLHNFTDITAHCPHLPQILHR